MSDIVMLKMCKVSTPKRQFVVVYDKSQKKFVCDCGFLEFCGMPCSHIIARMRSEYVNEFPLNLVAKRWLKSAKDDHVYTLPETAAAAKQIHMLWREQCLLFVTS